MAYSNETKTSIVNCIMCFEAGIVRKSGIQTLKWANGRDRYEPSFYLGFLSRTFTNHRRTRGKWGYFLQPALPVPPASQALRY